MQDKLLWGDILYNIMAGSKKREEITQAILDKIKMKEEFKKSPEKKIISQQIKCLQRQWK